MGEEKPEISPKSDVQVSIARSWIRNNMPTIVQALEVSRERVRESFRKNPDLHDHFPSPGEDIFSSALCIAFIKNFPDELLGDVQKIKSGVTQSYGNAKRRDSRNERNIEHAFLMYDKLIIDPTFGQFVDLDKSIEEHPELFEGRVFVGRPADAETKFRIKYSISPALQKRAEN